MSRATRNPTGMGENVTVIGLGVAVGNWLGGIVSDPNLELVIQLATTLAFKGGQQYLANRFNMPIAQLWGAKPNKGTLITLSLLVAFVGLGCETTAAQCKGYVAAARFAVQECERIEDEDDRGSCRVAALATLEIAEQECNRLD